MCGRHFTVMGSVSTFELFAIAMLPSSYPDAMLVLLCELAGLCRGELHSGTDLLCVVGILLSLAVLDTLAVFTL